MNVNWSETAIGHLHAIRDYVAQDSPAYAQAIIDRITRRTEILSETPHLGGKVPEYEDESIRELLEHPYRIIYQVDPDQVDVLAVIHGARKLPRTPPN